MRFADSPRSSVGIELELYCADPETSLLVGSGPEILDLAKQGDVPDKALQREYLTNTVEITSEPRMLVRDAIDDVRTRAGLLLDAADSLGLELGTSGTHPLAHWQDQEVDESVTHYSELLERTAMIGRQMLIWGVHVHVGVEDGDKALPLISRLQQYVPLFIALSASSPYWAGAETGYASFRTLVFQQLPQAGPAPHISDWTEFEALIASMQLAGVITQPSDLKWDIRPSHHYGTIEIRVCDSMSRLEEVAALTALIQCTVEYLSRQLDEGVPYTPPPSWLSDENRWSAARFGLGAILLTPDGTEMRALTAELDDLLAVLGPIAEELGCSAELAEVASIVHNGPGYVRQLAVNDARAAAQQVLGEFRASLGRTGPTSEG